VDDVTRFALIILVVAVAGLAAIYSNHLSRATRIPTPLIFLVGATVAVQLVPPLHRPPQRVVQEVATVALVVILFTGGAGIGLRAFRQVWRVVVSLGVVGTILCTFAMAAFAHLALGFDWYPAMLLATAIAPTDPAVVFSVLGQREVSGPAGLILQGESGANDPVGIALMTSLLAAGTLTLPAIGHASLTFTVQLVVGGLLGFVGARFLVWLVRTVPLPAESLYPLEVLAMVFALYGLTTVVGGSGFLAVFVAGILVGDEEGPHRADTSSVLATLTSFAEIVVFVALGLTIDLGVLSDADVWGPGLLLAAVLTLLVRPVLVGLCLLPARLPANEATFVLVAGLKGAVPILLGSFLITEHVAQSTRLYEIVVTVVLASVLVQGSLISWLARVLRIPVGPAEAPS
jgi:potassium/hydrogen antiporter